MKRAKIFCPKKISGGRIFNHRAKQLRLYSPAWERFRLNFLAKNSKCYVCGQGADVVDHVTPHLGNEKLFWKADNYIPLCAKCHNTITAKFDRYHRPGKEIKAKLLWISQMRFKHSLTLRVRVIDLPLEALELLNPQFQS